jgi:hypothetical protein
VVRYVVPGPTVLYSYGVKRYAVDTVWLQATLSFHPMLTTGEPIRDAPATSYLPGMVRCCSVNR